MVGKVLGTDAEVKMLTHEITLECKDLDEITTPQEITKAISDHLGIPLLEASVVKNMRKAYGNTQTAIISLPVTAANSLWPMANSKSAGWCVDCENLFNPLDAFAAWSSDT